MNVRHTSGERFAMVMTPPALQVKRLFDGFLRLLTETDTTLAEFTSSTTLLFVGAILALPTAALVPRVPLFHSMASFWPEMAWAACFFALGTIQSAANLSRNRKARRSAAFVAASFFGFLGILGASVHPISILGVVFGVHALTQGITYLRLGMPGVNAK